MTQPAPSPAPSVVFEIGTNPCCRVEIGAGVSRHLPDWLSSRAPTRIALVTDENVGPLHSGPLLQLLTDAGQAVAGMIAIPAGEETKTRATKERIEDALVDAGLSRDSIVIAMGGGVVTDIAGFVAATYMRGVAWVAVPTTLLGMVDASVGGKTGVDHPGGKNLIGAFHQPAAVFVDVEYLATLPQREYSSGLAELVKTATIGDAAMFDRIRAQTGLIIERDTRTMTELVAACCRFKADVVTADEREGDRRRILNFGHTIGHALELISGYRLAHGEAVSIGMVAESRLAVRIGLLAADAAGEIESLLASLGLPVRIPSSMIATTPGMILEAARHDKKSSGGRIMFVAPAAIGRMARGPDGHAFPVSGQAAIEILKEMA